MRVASSHVPLPSLVQDGDNTSELNAGERSRSMGHGFGKGREPRFELGNALQEPLVLFPSTLRHLANDLEFLTSDDARIVEDSFDLRLHEGIDLASHPLRRAGGIGHELAQLVEQAR